MSKIKNLVVGVVVALGLLAAISFATQARAAALTSAQTQAILSLLQSFGADATTVANVSAALTGAAAPANPALKFGSTGPAVTALQRELIAQGYDIPLITKSGVAYGYYGAQTVAAVNARNAAAPVVPTLPTSSTFSVTASSASSVLVQGQAIANLGTFTFSNTTGSDVKVTAVSLRRTGVSNDSVLANVYLYTGDTRLTDSAGVSNALINFNDPSGIFVVKAGSTVAVSVRADISTNSSGQQVGVSLVGVTSNGITSSVFPINTGYQTISSAELSKADFGSVLPTASEVNPQTDMVVWQSTLSVSTRAADLRALQLRVVGSTRSSDIANLRLYVDGIEVAKSGISTDLVNFDLSADPKRLETGSRVIKVVGDIVGGSGESFQFSLRRAADIHIVDVNLGQGILATVGNNSFSARTSGVIEIAEGQVSVSKSNTSPSSDVPLNASNVKFASFELRASGEDIKVENINVRVDATEGLQNGKVFFNGSQIGSAKNLTSTPTNFGLYSSMILKAGQVGVLEIYADAKKANGGEYSNGDQAKIVLTVGSSNAQRTVSYTSLNVPANEVQGNLVTLSSSSAFLSKYSGYGNQTFIAGSADAKIGSFVISTGPTQGVNVNTITLTDLSGTDVSDLKLVSNGVQLGLRSTVSSSNAFFVGLNVGPSSTRIIDVYANIKSTATGSFAASVDGSGNGTVTGSSVTLSSSSLQTITVGAGQLIAVVNNGSTPNNSLAIAGTLAKVGSFNFIAQNSAYTVDKILVKIPNNAATSVASVLIKGNGLPSEGVVGVVGVLDGEYSNAGFAGLTFNIPAGSSRALDVYVNLNPIQNDLDSGKAISVVLDANEGFRATDSSGTSTTTLAIADLNSSGNGKGVVFVKKTIPTLSAVALDSSVLTAGSQRVLARVEVTADPANDLSWTKLVFTLNKSSALEVTNFTLYRGSSLVGATSSPAGSSIVFDASFEQEVSGSTTYELRADVGGTLSSSSYVDVSITNPSASSSTGTSSSVDGSFVWSDRSSVSAVHSILTSDWTNDYLVRTLPLTVGNLNAN